MSSMHVVIKRLLKGVAVLFCFFLGGGGGTHFYISVHYIIITLFFLAFFNRILHLN